MNRKIFLTIVGCIALAIGLFAMLLPHTLLVHVKAAIPNGAAVVMARTVGALLISIGIMNLLIRSHEASSTLQAVLVANLVVQLGLLPIDPLAYVYGVFRSTGSFVPNTILHLVLAGGFAYFALKMNKGLPRAETPSAMG